ncbi:MAG: C39 family peptidase [Pseudonocardiaceae bacterium]
MEIRHRVPYFSQFASPDLVTAFVEDTTPAKDDPRWAESGADTPEEYAYWAWRGCGIACLRMVLAARGETPPPAVPLARECLRHGGYVRRGDQLLGLIYTPFTAWIEPAFGLKSQVRTELLVDQLAAEARTGLVMASVHPWLRWPERAPPHRGGHLVLVTGAGDDYLLVHNPSGLPGQTQEYARLPVATFARYYAGRGIVFSRVGSRSAAEQGWDLGE